MSKFNKFLREFDSKITEIQAQIQKTQNADRIARGILTFADR